MVFPFRRGHARRRFIDQQEPWLLRQQHADLQPLFLTMAQLACGTLQRICQADLVRHRPDPCGAIGVLAVEQHIQRPAWIAQRHGEVVAHALRLEHGGFWNFRPIPSREMRLSDMPTSEMPCPPKHAPLIRFGLARDDIHKGGFAAPLGPMMARSSGSPI